MSVRRSGACRYGGRMIGHSVHALEPWNDGRAKELIAAATTESGAVLPVLHAIQAAFGFISDDAVALVAAALNLSRAEIHGVVTFYHDFRRTRPGEHGLKLCRAEACQSMGGDALAARAQEGLGIGGGETTADVAITLEPVYCLGLCACAP